MLAEIVALILSPTAALALFIFLAAACFGAAMEISAIRNRQAEAARVRSVERRHRYYAERVH